MDIRVMKEGDVWIIAKNPRTVQSQGITGAAGGSSRSWPTNDGVWGENRCVLQRLFYQKFATQEEALDYLEENREAMEGSA